MHRVPHRRPKGGVGGAPGANIPQPGALGKDTDGGEVDYRTGGGRIPPSRGVVYIDERPVDGGAALQAPGGPATN